MERVIVFHMVNFQLVHLVSGVINISDRITSHLDLQNRDDYEELVQDSYRAVGEFVGNNHGTQNQEQYHRTFSNLILCSKF